MKIFFHLVPIFAVFFFLSCSKRSEEAKGSRVEVTESVQKNSDPEAIKSIDSVEEGNSKPLDPAPADIVKPPKAPNDGDKKKADVVSVDAEAAAKKLAMKRRLESKRKELLKAQNASTLKVKKDSINSSLDEELDNLSKGTIAFNTPQNIKYKSTSTIHLVLSPKEKDIAVAKLVESSGVVVTEEVQFSKFLEARLEGKNFEIEATTATRQPISLKDTTQWRWQITPLKAGKESLFLNIYAVVNIDGEKHERLLKTFTREMLISITFINHPVEYIKHRPLLVYVSLAAGACVLFFGGRGLKLGRRRKAMGESVSIGSKNVHADIFISYSSKDRSISTTLAELLRAKGLTVWMDVGGIAPAALWSAEIVNALKSAKVVVLVGSVNSFQSHNVVKEVSIASEQQTPIIPLIIDNSEIPDRLAYQLAGVQVIKTSIVEIDNSARIISEIISNVS